MTRRVTRPTSRDPPRDPPRDRAAGSAASPAGPTAASSQRPDSDGSPDDPGGPPPPPPPRCGRRTRPGGPARDPMWAAEPDRFLRWGTRRIRLEHAGLGWNTPDSAGTRRIRLAHAPGPTQAQRRRALLSPAGDGDRPGSHRLQRGFEKRTPAAPPNRAWMCAEPQRGRMRASFPRPTGTRPDAPTSGSRQVGVRDPRHDPLDITATAPLASCF